MAVAGLLRRQVVGGAQDGLGEEFSFVKPSASSRKKRARPRSNTLTTPVRLSNRLAGLMSRWIRPD